MEATFKHPNYPDARPYTTLTAKHNNCVVVRVEYPDGVIATFTITAASVEINSNRNYILDVEDGKTLIVPNLESINKDFVDVI